VIATKVTMSIFHKAFVIRSDEGRPWTKAVFEEFLDVIWYLRVVVLAPFLGVISGVLPLEGYVGFATYVIVSSLIIYIIYNNIVSIDVTSFGGDYNLLTEGFAQGGAIFVLTWTILYTWLHSEVEEFYYEDYE
jgi:hypothetical protein